MTSLTRILLRRGAPLRNDVTDRWGKHILKANTKKKASSQGGVRTPCTLPLDPPLNCRWWGLVWKEFEAHNKLENHFRRVSSALYVEAKKSEPRTWSGRMCLFVESDQHHFKNPPQFWPIASKNDTTALQRLLQFLKVGTVYKYGLRVGVKICFAGRYN